MTKTRQYIAKSLRLKDIYFEDIIQGKKVSTIRFGYVIFNDLVIDLKFDEKPMIKVSITKIDYSKTFETITQDDAVSDGYDSVLSLLEDLRRYYPDIQETSPVTICHFKIIEGPRKFNTG